MMQIAKFPVIVHCVDPDFSRISREILATTTVSGIEIIIDEENMCQKIVKSTTQLYEQCSAQ